MHQIQGLLITGGTGSFGKAFVKTVLAEHPHVQRLVISSRDELKQYEMEQVFSPADYPGLRYLADGATRADSFQALREAGIGVNVDYQRLGFAKGDYPVAEAYYERTISLPLHPRLTEAQQHLICQCLGGCTGD